MKQTITSAATSINAKKVPALFKRVQWKPGTRNLDLGGGRYNTATEYLEGKGVLNWIYDPYNRSEAENQEAMQCNPDTVTISNVLNVIKEPEARRELLELAKSFNCPVYITVYEGNGSGEGRETRAGWQENRKLAEYVEEVATVFGFVVRHGSVITARGGRPA